MDNLLYDTTRKYNYHTKTSVEYLNIECSFDIETSSTYTKDGKKFSFMYLWGFGIGEHSDYLKYGRTWEEFHELLNHVANELNISINVFKAYTILFLKLGNPMEIRVSTLTHFFSNNT